MANDAERRLERDGYVADVDQVLAFIPNDEISQVRWWDGSEAIGTISVIDQKLIELV